MACYSPLRGYKHNDTGAWVSKKTQPSQKKMDVPCGQCIGCRIGQSLQWAARIVHEAQCWPNNTFITLTYDDKHMPRLWTDGPGTLRKEDHQEFMKALRHKFEGQKIRYYHTGEYGNDFDRPHYHSALFNLAFDDKKFYKQHKGNPLYISETLKELWTKGNSSISDLTYESAAYIARYCIKKVTGNRATDYYLRHDDYGVAYWLEPEYTTMSRGGRTKNPEDNLGGIGQQWAKKYLADLWPADETPIPGKKPRVIKGVPRFYYTQLEKDHPELAQLVLDKRNKWLEEHQEEYTLDRLHSKYRVKKAQIDQLHRGDINHD